MNRECGITTVDEVSFTLVRYLSPHLFDLSKQSEIPERWRAAALSKVEMLPEDEVRTGSIASLSYAS